MGKRRLIIWGVVITVAILAAGKLFFFNSPSPENRPQVKGEAETAPPEPPADDQNADPDQDGLTNGLEKTYHTDPLNPDTDGDGYNDGLETENGFSPLVAGAAKMHEIDTDRDGLNDALELSFQTDLNDPDTDQDGFSDGEEVFHGFNPLKGDHDQSWERRTEIDLSRQQLTYYLNDVKLGQIPVSTGRIPLETPKGEFQILAKKPLVNYRGRGYNYPNTKWNLMFKNGYYIHGAYWHNDFGKKPRSHGCVNVSYQEVEKIYDFMKIGDRVAIVGQTPR